MSDTQTDTDTSELSEMSAASQQSEANDSSGTVKRLRKRIEKRTDGDELAQLECTEKNREKERQRTERLELRDRSQSDEGSTQAFGTQPILRLKKTVRVLQAQQARPTLKVCVAPHLRQSTVTSSESAPVSDVLLYASDSGTERESFDVEAYLHDAARYSQKIKRRNNRARKEATEYRAFQALRARSPLSKCPILQSKAEFLGGVVIKRKRAEAAHCIWQDWPLPNPLTHNGRGLQKLTTKIFRLIMAYMGDAVHAYPVARGYEVVSLGKEQKELRDEIFCQLIKQTTLNPSEESTILGLKLMYMCISTFVPSTPMVPFVMSHLALFAHLQLPSKPPGTDKATDLATNCWVAYRRLLVAGLTEAEPPTILDCENLTRGFLPDPNSISVRPRSSRRSPSHSIRKSKSLSVSLSSRALCPETRNNDRSPRSFRSQTGSSYRSQSAFATANRQAQSHQRQLSSGGAQKLRPSKNVSIPGIQIRSVTDGVGSRQTRRKRPEEHTHRPATANSEGSKEGSEEPRDMYTHFECFADDGDWDSGPTSVVGQTERSTSKTDTEGGNYSRRESGEEDERGR